MSALRRIDELRADLVLCGLGEEERDELRVLTLADGVGEEGADESLELAAAAAMVGMVDDKLEDMPCDVMARLGAIGREQVAQATQPDMSFIQNGQPVRAEVWHGTARRGGARRSWFGVAGWLVAALLVVAIGLWPEPGPAARMRALARASDAISWDWTVIHSDLPEMQRFKGGRVVWSSARQEGYMTFEGLAVNDASVEQYQLWIFESADQAQPIDGGVFDVTSQSGVVVPIDATIPVDHAAMFAVTIEQPGGVVVSDRVRIPVLAKPAG